MSQNVEKQSESNDFHTKDTNYKVLTKISSKLSRISKKVRKYKKLLNR